MTDDDEGADEGADEWRFGVDEVGPEAGDDSEAAASGADGANADGETDDDEADDGGNVAGSLLELEDELEPGTPSLEGTMFVLIGAFATVLFLLEAGGVL